MKKPFRNSTFMRVSRYVAVRLLTLFVTVVIGIYLTIMIANMGGYVDQIIKGEIRDRVTQPLLPTQRLQQMDPEVRKKLIEEKIALEEERRGLNTPIAVRNVRLSRQCLELESGTRHQYDK